MMMWLRRPLFRATTAFVVELYCNSSGGQGNSIQNMTARMTMTRMESSSSSNSTAAVDPYKSSSFIGHSLWMCPSGNASQAYSDIISDMAKELGTFQFTPHITLVAAMLTGEQDVLERSRQLASQLAPYQFEFQEVSRRDAYFQCVYPKMKLTPEVVAAMQGVLTEAARPQRTQWAWRRGRFYREYWPDGLGGPEGAPGLPAGQCVIDPDLEDVVITGELAAANRSPS